MRRFIVLLDDKDLPFASDLSNEIQIPIRTDIKSFDECEILSSYDGTSVHTISFPEFFKFDSATTRYYLSGHTVHVTDEFSDPRQYTSIYTSPSGISYEGDMIIKEKFYAVFFHELGEVGNWNLQILDENKDVIYSQIIEAVDEDRAI